MSDNAVWIQHGSLLFVSSEKLIALDLISQAEHGVDSVLILLTTSLEIGEKVINEFNRVLKSGGNLIISSPNPYFTNVMKTLLKILNVLKLFIKNSF